MFQSRDKRAVGFTANGDRPNMSIFVENWVGKPVASEVRPALTRGLLIIWLAGSARLC
jgi:hypothetical protein